MLEAEIQHFEPHNLGHDIGVNWFGHHLAFCEYPRMRVIDTALPWVSVTSMSPKPKLRAATPWVVAALSFSVFFTLCTFLSDPNVYPCHSINKAIFLFGWFVCQPYGWSIGQLFVCWLVGIQLQTVSIGAGSDIELYLGHMSSLMHESDNFTLSRFPFPLVAMSFLSGLTANAALVGSWPRFLRPLLQFGSFCPEPGCDRWWWGKGG